MVLYLVGSQTAAGFQEPAAAMFPLVSFNRARHTRVSGLETVPLLAKGTI